MSQSARIEELSDSDSDPEITDISSLAAPTSTKNPSLIDPSAIPQASQQPRVQFTAEHSASKKWQCLYPIYFDSSRSKSEGRRVPHDLAVANPLARTIADAVTSLGLKCVFNPGKIHPRDWANPGRVSVETKSPDGRWTAAARGVNNKHHLYRLVAEFLKARPTKPEDTLRLQIRGMPEQTEPLPPPAVPRGWKVNAILPLHSPAVTGGGVSENFLKDMMAEMQGLPPSASAAGGEKSGSGKKEKKDKKKK